MTPVEWWWLWYQIILWMSDYKIHSLLEKKKHKYLWHTTLALFTAGKGFRCQLERAFIHITLQLLYSHRIEVLHSVGCESFSYLHCGCHTCQGMPVAHRFAHSNYVGTEILPLLLKTPEVTPQTPKACLHFVCNKHSTSWMYISVEGKK